MRPGKPMRVLSAILFLTLLAVACPRMAPLPARLRSRSPERRRYRAQLTSRGNGPFPVVIAARLRRTGRPPSRCSHATATGREQLLKTGHAVLLPDSYGSRELGHVMRQRARRVPPAASG